MNVIHTLLNLKMLRGGGAVKRQTSGSTMENYSMRNTENNFSKFCMSVALKLHSIPVKIKNFRMIPLTNMLNQDL